MFFTSFLFFFYSFSSFSSCQLIDTIGLDSNSYSSSSNNNKTPFKPSLRPSNYNRTEIITKYSLEQIARNIIIKEKSKIFNEWDLRHYPLFLETFHIPNSSWKLYKAKFIDLLLKNKANNITKFVIGFTGSSVTAGHDNYFNESYPSVFNYTLQKVFSALKIELEVRNHAMGNNPCYPYDSCLSTHIGSDVDIITWEQSMNCGRNPKPVESFIRSAARLPKKPMIIFIASGTPFWKPIECSTISNETKPLNSHETELLRLPLNVVSNTSSSVLERLPFFGASENLLDHYKNSIAPSVQGINDVISKYKCKGPYGPTFGLKTKGEGKSWHPGVLGHKYRADSLSYFILEILKEAIDEVIVASMEGPHTLHNLHQSNIQILSSLIHLPKPIACSTQVCQITPKCFTNYEPRIQNNLSSIIVATTDNYSNNLIPSNWKEQLSWFDKGGVEKSILEERGYLDKKYIIRSNFNGNGSLTIDDSTSILTFLIETTQKNSIWICQVQKGFLKYPSTDGELNNAAIGSITLNVPSNINRFIPFTNAFKGKPITFTKSEDECFQTEPIDKGKHYLSIWPKDKSVQINIAYILYW